MRKRCDKVVECRANQAILCIISRTFQNFSDIAKPKLPQCVLNSMYNQPHAQFLPQCQSKRLYIEKEAHAASLDIHGGHFVVAYRIAYLCTLKLADSALSWKNELCAKQLLCILISICTTVYDPVNCLSLGSQE